MYRRIIKLTPFGSVGVIWSSIHSSVRITRVLLSKPGFSAEERVNRLYPDSRNSSCMEIEAVATGIRAFLEGEDIVLPLDALDLDRCPAFQRAVLRAEHGIPWGSLSTYKLIAAHLGKPKGARAVGNALATNPFPLIVPCHRAIRSDRHLGGYQGGLEMKRALLEREGIPLDASGRAVIKQLHFAHD
jgi:methylated-DNA-[protein]-cysteine S-methyltransferase